MSEIKIESMQDEFINSLSEQLCEYELLKAMYPNQGDIVLTDKCILEEINNFINGQSDYAPSNLDFVINLFIDGLKLEICVNLPLSYPNEEPDIFIRCNQLSRQEETNLNIQLTEFIKTIFVGEVCLYNVITWVQDNIGTFVEKQITDKSKSLSKNHNTPVEDKFVRLWIYSHHIYNKKKREEILKKAKELKLTGFCLPGKPGIICIEGDNSACQEWWRDIKSMCWQKIMVRKTETFEPSEERKERKFNNFVELTFPTQTNSRHANMSEFSKFMSENDLSDLFNELFGLNSD